MQIITVDDCDFPSLLETLLHAREIGKYTKNGQVQIVRACERFMLISPENSPQKIAIKPARNQSEAMTLGKQFLAREKQRGSEVEYCAENKG